MFGTTPEHDTLICKVVYSVNGFMSKQVDLL